jgi:hypothetical protein
MRARLVWLAFVLTALSLSSFAAAQPSPAAPAGASPPSTASPDAAKAEAFRRFQAGLDHFDRQEWSAALAEFLKSRELYRTRAATKNAAICLRKEGRFDEALEMYEELLRDFPDLPQQDRDFAGREIQQLQGSIGAVDVRGAEPGATVVIDGRERGTAPVAGPLRVSAGSHVVRVFKEGFVPFESRVDVAGQQSVVVQVRLDALGQEKRGRMRVVEQTGRALDVVVDDVVVGKTPWEGTLAVGDHTIALRGPGNLGTQPASAPVRAGQLTSLDLVAEDLAASARVEPVPAGALVSVDGIAVGRGVWDGKLRVGDHVFEAAAEGFLPYRRQVTLASGERQHLVAQLDRDQTSPLWAARHPPHLVIEVEGSGGVTPVFGGLLGNCSGACSAPLPVAVRGVLHGAYQLGTGVGFGVDVGYMALLASAGSRSVQVVPVGERADPGVVNDDVRISGLTAGASVFYRVGDDWPLTFRLGGGLLLGSARDARTGSGTNSFGGSFAIDAVGTDSGTYLYVVPEVRVGRRIGKSFEVSLGIEALALAALHQPQFPPSLLQNTASTANPTQGDGEGPFSHESIAGTLLFAVLPSLGARYDF